MIWIDRRVLADEDDMRRVRRPDQAPGQRRSRSRDRITEPQRAALKSMIETGSPTTHLRGMSQFGGFEATRAALIRKGWMTPHGEITEAGRAAYRAVND